MEQKIFDHKTYYVFEFLLLLFGFLTIRIFNANTFVQLSVLLFLLVSYTVLGVVHHRANHTFSAQIVLEYILVSGLVISGFLFLIQ